MQQLYLNVQHNNISDTGAKAIAELMDNKCLRTLS
jgi:hypothetical protein